MISADIDTVPKTALDNTDSSAPTDFAVLANKLTRRFGNFTAVDHIDLAVKPGEIFGFLGANGAGKTTAIRMFCGLLKPSGGEAWVHGLSIKKKAEVIKRKIGYMSQKFSLYNDLTIYENLEFYGGIYGLKKSEIKERSKELLDNMGLQEYRNKLTSALPLGFKQRLALGSAMFHRPSILFLDEPTSGVDPVARRIFWEMIYELSENGTTVFVTTHYMDEAEYCDRVSIMVKGRIAAMDSPAELKKKWNGANMQEVFLKVVET
ncbi:MAG: ATP-binding cassette domain-containing protein [Candidatus Electryonea clarkiae]|nr:ATP-binding cassette domain-containing protein [Candidatus Electryonea clarkiae]MDP8287514.1 ATP-binding cassette domain-containing protein [Candidatus Electryonea clarkiae]